MASIIRHRDQGEIIFTEPTPIELVEFQQTLDEPHGWIAYSAVFGLVPYTEEGPVILAPTAFNRTLREQDAHAIPIYHNHQKADFPIAANGGNWTDNKGLQYKALVDSEHPLSVEVYKAVKSGRINQHSIGFGPPWKVSTDKATGYPKYTEVYLDHHSVVNKGANPATITVETFGADNGELIEWGALPYQNLPLADTARAWDASGAAKRVKAWAGDDMGKYAKAFMWVDSEKKENVTAYKLGYADIIDGKLTAIPRGIFAIAAVLKGARGGVDIPESDISKIKAHVKKYYNKMDREVPWHFEGKSVILLSEDELSALVTERIDNAFRNAGIETAFRTLPETAPPETASPTDHLAKRHKAGAAGASDRSRRQFVADLQETKKLLETRNVKNKARRRAGSRGNRRGS